MDRPPPPRPRARRAPAARRRLAAGGLLALLAPALLAPAALAQGVEDRQGDDDVDVGDQPLVEAEEFPLVEDPRLAPALWAVPVEGAEVDAALERYRVTEDALERATDDEAAAAGELAELVAAEQRLARRATEVERRRAKSGERLDALGAALRSLVVADFVRGGTGSSVDADLDLTDLGGNAGRRVLVRSAVHEQLAEVAAHAAVVRDMTAAAEVIAAERAEVAARTAATTARRDEAAGRRTTAAARLAEESTEVADARLTSWVADTDLPLIALDAYVRAAATIEAEDPECALDWSLLAGVGRTESRHGTYGGARPLGDGSLSEPILGIPLDGTRSASIPDTDGGALDTDPVWDRAVGPMQFIPSTWQRWARDGDGDEVADPQDLHDATLTAAAYLCATSRNLDEEPGARRALLSYNRSTPYGTTVLERAAAYAEAVPLPEDAPPPLPLTPDAAPPGGG